MFLVFLVVLLNFFWVFLGDFLNNPLGLLKWPFPGIVYFLGGFWKANPSSEAGQKRLPGRFFFGVHRVPGFATRSLQELYLEKKTTLQSTRKCIREICHTKHPFFCIETSRNTNMFRGTPAKGLLFEAVPLNVSLFGLKPPSNDTTQGSHRKHGR